MCATLESEICVPHLRVSYINIQSTECGYKIRMRAILTIRISAKVTEWRGRPVCHGSLAHRVK